MTASGSIGRSARRSGSLIVFLVFAYLLMWVCFFAVAFTGMSANSPLGYSLLLLGAFAPAIVAVAMTALSAGEDGVRALLRPALRWQVAGKWYVFALAYIAALKLCAALIYRLSKGTWPHFGDGSLYLIPIAIAFSTPFQIGEEAGWRGFALPRLAERFGLPLASLILGVIWGVWHLPQFFVRGADTYGQSFWFFVLQVTAMSVAFAWLWMHTGKSLLLTMLLHSSVNNSKDIVSSAISRASSPFVLRGSPIGWLTLILLWACAGCFLVDMSHREKHRADEAARSATSEV